MGVHSISVCCDALAQGWQNFFAQLVRSGARGKESGNSDVFGGYEPYPEGWFCVVHCFDRQLELWKDVRVEYSYSGYSDTSLDHIIKFGRALCAARWQYYT